MNCKSFPEKGVFCTFKSAKNPVFPISSSSRLLNESIFIHLRCSPLHKVRFFREGLNVLLKPLHRITEHMTTKLRLQDLNKFSLMFLSLFAR